MDRNKDFPLKQGVHRNFLRTDEPTPGPSEEGSWPQDQGHSPVLREFSSWEGLGVGSADPGTSSVLALQASSLPRFLR
jgi:hypothetical protein